jgi:ATP-dependent DNA ligase
LKQKFPTVLQAVNGLDFRSTILDGGIVVNGIQVGSWIPTRGQDLLSEAKEKGLEGIVAKRIEGIYLPGQRTKD